jgi:hypothetical protein
MMDGANSAKLQKLQQLKQLMMELMAEEGVGMDDTMPKAQVTEMVASMEEPDEEGEGAELEVEMSEAEPMDEKAAMIAEIRKDFLTPRKGMEERPSAMMFGSASPLMDMAKPMEKTMEIAEKLGPKGKTWLKGKGKYA